MEFLVITGLSGAGKSRAADVMEDLNYYCVDNIPAALTVRLAEFCKAAGGRYEKVALVIDAREKEGIGEIVKALDSLKESGINCRVLFMDADNKTIVRRYKESRRPHPLAEAGVTVTESIKRERELLAPVRERADFIVDTSSLTLGMLQGRLFSLLSPEGQTRSLDITIMSFGYKYGLPPEADMVFDARFLPNPFYEDALRNLSGLDAPVAEYVFKHSRARDFLMKLEDMIEYLIPMFIEEGKTSLTVAVGCTGGRHRSVALAAALNAHFVSNGLNSSAVHRDVDRQLQG